MIQLYRVQIDDKINYKLGDVWPDDSPMPDGVAISDRYVIGAMFHVPENDGDEGLPAYFELWAQPKGVEDPPDDFPTFRGRLWLDAPMKACYSVTDWATAKQAIQFRAIIESDEDDEEEVPQNGTAKPAALTASPG